MFDAQSSSSTATSKAFIGKFAGDSAELVDQLIAASSQRARPLPNAADLVGRDLVPVCDAWLCEPAPQANR